MTRRLRLLPALVLLLAACEGPQSALDHAGAQARHIASLWWVMLALSTLVWLGITAALARALLRPRAPGEDPHHPARSRARSRAIGAAVGVIVLFLGVILVHTLLVERANARMAEGEALVIDVVGYQWWWDIHYRDPVPARHFRTANELYLPAGRNVELHLRAADVIHSLWIPNLHGKMDLLPGRTNVLRLRPEREGVFRGQCAEFCGIQHALMALPVVVVSDDAFARWADAQRASAAPPADSLARRGQQVFLGTSCVLCHQVRGTIANAAAGPDLTHMASRRTLAAGTVPNTRGHLAGWILDPQATKPGTYMPPTQLSSDDLQALLHYLEGLR